MFSAKAIDLPCIVRLSILNSQSHIVKCVSVFTKCLDLYPPPHPEQISENTLIDDIDVTVFVENVNFR